MQLDSKEDIIKIVRIGRNLGYPACCIKEFVVGMDWRSPNSPKPVIGWEDTGFLPCSSCAKKEYEIVSELIASRRLVSTPFPISAKDRLATRPEYEIEVSLIADDCIKELRKYCDERDGKPG